MKTMIRFSLVVLLFMSVKLMAQDDMSSLKSVIQQMEDNWNKALASSDAAALASMYTDDAISLPDKSPMWQGRNAILEYHKKDNQAVKYSSASSKTLNVFGKDDLVYEIGTYAVTFTPSGAAQPVNEEGKYITIWQKQSDGSWKIKADTWNTNVPESTQAGAKEKE